MQETGLDYCGYVEHLVGRWQEAIALVETLGSLAEACRQTGLSRKEVDEAQWTFETGGLAALRSRAQRAVRRRPDFVAAVEREVVRLSQRHPAWGRGRLSRLATSRGFPISASGVRRALLRAGRWEGGAASEPSGTLSLAPT